MVKTFKQFLNETNLSRVWQHTQERNIAQISASRGHLTADENFARNKELAAHIKKLGYGHVHVKGRYIENHGTDKARDVDEHSILVIGKKGDDHGELLGHMKKLGAQYDQDSILHKKHNEKHALLHGTNESGWPGKDKTSNVGDWHPNRAGEFHTVLRNGRKYAFEHDKPLKEQLANIPDVMVDIGFYQPRGWYNRSEELALL